MRSQEFTQIIYIYIHIKIYIYIYIYHGPNTNPSKPQTNPNSQSENLFCNIESSEATGNVSPGTGKSHVEELDNRLENHPIEQQPFSFREWPCPKSSKKNLASMPTDCRGSHGGP